MTTQHVSVTVNGQVREADVEPRLLLVHLLRDVFGLTGTHTGCDTSNCGACTVHVNGRSAKSCTMLAVQADGAEIATIEGMEQGGKLHPLQQAFWDQHGLQCGFCTPGMIMQSAWLLGENPDPTEAEIREGISGNLCRCTGYVNIVEGGPAGGGGAQGGGSRARDRRGVRLSPEETTMTEAQAPTTTAEVSGHGPFDEAQGGPALHPGQGAVHRGRHPPEHGLDGHRPEPVRPRDDQVHRRDRGPGDAGRARGDHRQGPRGRRPPLDADARRRQADGAAGRHRHVPVARRSPRSSR